MGADDRVELQAEVDAPRAAVYALLSTPQGLRRWLDEADMEPVVGRSVRFRLHDGIAVGKVLAVDPPQHISFAWDWEAEPMGVPSVVALDAIDHGARTHVTLRHVGFRGPDQVRLHEALWAYWFGRFRIAASAEPYP